MASATLQHGVASSPFGSHAHAAAACPAPRPSVSGACMRRAPSSSAGLGRQMSSTLQLQTQHTLQMPRSRSRCCAIAEALSLVVADSTAAMASFEDLAEALGDVAKLDNLVGGASSPAAVVAAAASAAATSSSSPASAAVAATAAAAAAAVPDVNVAAAWALEKVVGSLGQFSLLEGLVDKALLDLFQQVFGALELAGSAFDTPWLRLGAAGVIALAVRQALVAYRAAHPARLARQLSPATSLGDAVAEAAAAALASVASAVTPGSSNVKQSKQQQQANTQQSNKQQFKHPKQQQGVQLGSSALLPAAQASSPLPAANAAVAAVGRPLALASSSLVLGQVKRGARLARQAGTVAAEAAAGRWSPAALLVGIEAAALVHNYSELAQGMVTLLHWGA